jgi:hypothetical protein
MTQYFVMRGEGDAVLALFRIRRSPNAVYTEALRNGEWIPWAAAGEFLFDLDPRDHVDEAEAAAIAHKLGGHL